jgi:hypothetical protein
MSPLSERGGAVLLEGVTAVGVAVLIEVVLDRGMGGGAQTEDLQPASARLCQTNANQAEIAISGLP